MVSDSLRVHCVFVWGEVVGADFVSLLTRYYHAVGSVKQGNNSTVLRLSDGVLLYFERRIPKRPSR